MATTADSCTQAQADFSLADKLAVLALVQQGRPLKKALAFRVIESACVSLDVGDIETALALLERISRDKQEQGAMFGKSSRARYDAIIEEL